MNWLLLRVLIFASRVASRLDEVLGHCVHCGGESFMATEEGFVCDTCGSGRGVS